MLGYNYYVKLSSIELLRVLRKIQNKFHSLKFFDREFQTREPCNKF